MGMEADSSTGPDRLLVIFFKKLWDKIQAVIMPMFHEFYIGTLVTSHLNFGVTTLIPKIAGAMDI
jgi:hypothetical protein